MTVFLMRLCSRGTRDDVTTRQLSRSEYANVGRGGSSGAKEGSDELGSGGNVLDFRVGGEECFPS